MAEFFGFEINRKGKSKEPVRPSFVPRTDGDDGAGVIQAGGHFGAYIDMDGDKAKTDVDQILKYVVPANPWYHCNIRFVLMLAKKRVE